MPPAKKGVTIRKGLKAFDKAQPVQYSPCDADALQPCAAFVHRAPAPGEVHHKQGDRGSDNGGNRGDDKDLVVDILHDFIGLCPYISGIDRHGVRQGGGQCKDSRVDGSGWGKPAPGLLAGLQSRLFGVFGLFLQFLQTSCYNFCAQGMEKGRACGKWAQPWDRPGIEKAPSGKVPCPAVSVPDIILSILSVTHHDLRGKGKTVPISCQSVPIMCQAPVQGKTGLKSLRCLLLYNPTGWS